MTRSFPLVFLEWFGIHFPNQILENGQLLAVWCWRYFSIGFFLPRIFSPWHKDLTSYGRGFDYKAWIHALGWNLISRVLGAVLRSLFILTGLCLEVLIMILTLAAFLIWYLLPVLAFYLLFIGV